jgi:hypothetical protein
VPFADNLRDLEWVDVLTVAALVVAVMLTVGVTGIVGVVFGLSVGICQDPVLLVRELNRQSSLFDWVRGSPALWVRGYPPLILILPGVWVASSV